MTEPGGPFCVNVTLFEGLRRLARGAEPVPELRDPRIPWRLRVDAWLTRADRLLGADR